MKNKIQSPQGELKSGNVSERQQEGGSDQCGPIAKSDKEKPKAKATWQGVAGWVTKHEIAFNTLKTLQWAGGLLYSDAITTTLPWVSTSKNSSKSSPPKDFHKKLPLYFPHQNCPTLFILLTFQYLERVFVPLLSLLASLLYGALALAFFFKFL